MRQKARKRGDMQDQPEVTVDDLRKILILTIRDGVLKREAGGDVNSPAGFDAEEWFKCYCRNLDYFDIEYDVDEVWEHFRRLVGDCAPIALKQIGAQAGKRDVTLKAA